MFEIAKQMTVLPEVMEQMTAWRDNIQGHMETIGNGDLNHLHRQIKEANGTPWLSEHSVRDHTSNNEKIVYEIAFLEGRDVFKTARSLSIQWLIRSPPCIPISS